MKVLFCGLKYEYGRPTAGLSFEYQNFYEVLRRMDRVQAEGFFIDEKILEVGRDAMNPWLIKTVEESRPDLLFCFLFTEELKKETIDYITRKTATKTFNWFADDHWRLPIFSRHWAPLFTMVSTTDSKAVKRYRALGIHNVVKTQWAANPGLYQPQDQSKNPGTYDVTFVGKNYGNRGSYIAFLQSQNLPAVGWGGGWPSGRVSHQQMLEIFSYSKINLNFTESPYMTTKDRGKVLAKLAIKKELGSYKFNANNFIDNVKSALGTQRRQIKGRTFEVPACGGFLLTGDADNLRDYYVDGKEIVIFKDKRDLAEKCRYYLAHDQERKAIAKAGFERTLRGHTYEQRFRQIFKALALM
ncbi:MAG: glycosyltransferase [Patescibacteria group bacterium]|nr:glycosyltransferase [Patescibacteria group bacterium]